MNRFSAALLAVASALAITACASDHGTTPTGPSAAAGTSGAGTASTPSLVGTWVSTTKAAPASTTISLAACAIQMQIASQTATQATGTLSMVCPNNLNLSGAVVAQLGGATIPLTWDGTATQPGLSSCTFSLTGVGTQLSADMFHLTYSGTTCMGPVQGEDTLRLALPTSPAPAPTPIPTPVPAPAPAPVTPPPPPVGLGADAIDLSRATILNSPLNLASWPITTPITAVDIRPNGVHVDFSKQSGTDRWPDITPPGWDGPLQWTLGMVLNIGGRWYASAPIEFWYGLQESGGPPQDYALNWFYDPGRWAPMTYHQPAVGETIGFFACAGDCRNNTAGSLSPVKERSNVVLVTMPGSGGARFTF
jgi:hypothetical protein